MRDIHINCNFETRGLNHETDMAKVLQPWFFGGLKNCTRRRRLLHRLHDSTAVQIRVFHIFTTLTQPYLAAGKAEENVTDPKFTQRSSRARDQTIIGELEAKQSQLNIL